MGADDDADCAGHLWRLDGVHLSLGRGAERTETCTRCAAIRYVPDTARRSRPRLKPPGA